MPEDSFLDAIKKSIYLRLKSQEFCQPAVQYLYENPRTYFWRIWPPPRG